LPSYDCQNPAFQVGHLSLLVGQRRIEVPLQETSFVHFSTIVVLRQAMDRFEFADLGSKRAAEVDLNNRFRRLRGMLGDLSREQMLIDRHDGLA